MPSSAFIPLCEHTPSSAQHRLVGEGNSFASNATSYIWEEAAVAESENVCGSRHSQVNHLMGHVWGYCLSCEDPLYMQPSRIQMPSKFRMIILMNGATTERRLFVLSTKTKLKTYMKQTKKKQQQKSPKVHFHLNSIYLYFTATTHLELFQQLFYALPGNSGALS